MRDTEHVFLQRQLHAMPTLPWLWVAPGADWMPPRPADGRGIRLCVDAIGGRFGGDVQCALPLPLPAESVNAIVLQHAAGADVGALLEECSRVLMPGGRLWMTLFNSCSPYRLHWHGYVDGWPSAARCRRLLQGNGLQCAPLGYLGPAWGSAGRPGWPVPAIFRAVCVLQAHKRTAARVGPTARPVRVAQPVVS